MGGVLESLETRPPGPIPRRVRGDTLDLAEGTTPWLPGNKHLILQSSVHPTVSASVYLRSNTMLPLPAHLARPGAPAPTACFMQVFLELPSTPQLDGAPHLDRNHVLGISAARVLCR